MAESFLHRIEVFKDVGVVKVQVVDDGDLRLKMQKNTKKLSMT